MNVYTPAAAAMQTDRRTLRVASLCGSIKPLFSGTDDFHENLISILGQRNFDVQPIEREKWGLRQIPDLLAQVTAERPDVILLQYPTDAFNASLAPHAFSLMQRQAPLVVTLHEYSAANPLRRMSMTALLARAAAVVVTSDFERAALLAAHPWLRSRTLVIPIGSNFPASPWRPVQPPTVVYFGQIRPEKGIEAFIACRKALAPHFPDVKFIIVGSRVPKFAAYAATVEATCRSDDIALCGGLQASELSDFLATATVALLPYPSGASFRRGSLLAALACGVPVVTTSGTETPPEINRALQPGSSQQDLVAQMTRYLADDTALQAAHQSSLNLSALVSWDAIGDLYADVLLSVCSRPAAQ